MQIIKKIALACLASLAKNNQAAKIYSRERWQMPSILLKQVYFLVFKTNLKRDYIHVFSYKIR